MRTFPPLSVDDADEGVLRGWVDAGSEGPQAARRAHIVLLSGAGLGPSAVADQIGCSKQTVITWRERYRTHGLPGLCDAPRSGRPATVDPLAVVARTLGPPAPGVARWSTRTLAAELGISNVAVANIWRAWGISPAAGGRVRLATEPVLERGVVAVHGLHLGSATRVLAVRLDDGSPGPSGMRVEASGHLPGIDVRPRTDDLPVLLGRLDPSPPLALLVDGPADEVHRWAATRRGVTVHAVPPVVAWSRIVRAACLAATGNPCGTASVTALRAALGDHRGEAAFTWVRSRSGDVKIDVAGCA